MATGICWWLFVLWEGYKAQITGTKKNARLVPCGLPGLPRTTLVIVEGEFWWAAGRYIRSHEAVQHTSICRSLDAFMK